VLKVIDMKKIVIKMLKIYKPISNLDWLNYKLVKHDLTYHHIIKREYGGKETIENGALLVRNSHSYLHLIECKDLEKYIVLNKLLQIINNQKCEPTMDQRKIIEYILQEFEKEHSRDKTSKGKILIKEEYKKRW
jgi:hypothetical protein